MNAFESNQTRRSFMKKFPAMGAAASAIPLATGSVFAANPKRKMTVGVLGAGGRGGYLMSTIKEAADKMNIELDFIAACDIRSDVLDRNSDHFGIPEAHRFIGFDGYRKVCELEPDIALLAAPPAFRPLHFEAAVDAGCHCFVEKPVAVDAPGARHMYAVGEKAKAKGLTIIAGTQRRHAPARQEMVKAIRNGDYGAMRGGRVFWLGRVPWVRRRQGGESNAMYMARNWLHFNELSGDHIVEQHVHNIDIANWYIGRNPRLALGFGGRIARETGNQYDFFSVDFDYGDACNVHSMCRQLAGVYSRIGEDLCAAAGSIPSVSDNSDPMTNMLQSIVNEESMNETKSVTNSTVAALMGRDAAYTGQIVRWVDYVENDNSDWYNKKLTPTAEDFETQDDVELPEEEVAPIPGQA